MMPEPNAVWQKYGGEVALREFAERPLLLVEAKGYIGPWLLQKILAYAWQFGQKYLRGWDYAVDTTSLTFAHPLNPYYLRKIHHLPNLNRYIVIPPQTFPLNLLNPVVDWLIRPDLTLETVQELFE